MMLMKKNGIFFFASKNITERGKITLIRGRQTKRAISWSLDLCSPAEMFITVAPGYVKKSGISSFS